MRGKKPFRQSNQRHELFVVPSLCMQWQFAREHLLPVVTHDETVHHTAKCLPISARIYGPCNNCCYCNSGPLIPRKEQFRCGLTSCEPALKQEFQNYVLLLTLRFDVSKNSPAKWMHYCKAMAVTGRGGPKGCETSRLSYFLDNRLTGSGYVINLTRRLRFTLHEDSWYWFL
jgi:hypothetical protein